VANTDVPGTAGAAVVACLGFCRGRHALTMTCACADVSWWARTAIPGSRPPRRPPKDRTPPRCLHHRRRRRRCHRRRRRRHVLRRHRSSADWMRRRRCVCNPIEDNYRLHRKAYRKQKTNKNGKEEKEE